MSIMLIAVTAPTLVFQNRTYTKDANHAVFKESNLAYGPSRSMSVILKLCWSVKCALEKKKEVATIFHAALMS